MIGPVTVGLILVSHSRDLAAGLAALAGQMATSVTIVPAGGTDEGGIGTSFDLVSAAVERADTGDGAVLLYDIGSALMTSDTVLELLDEDRAARIRVVDAPLVEAAVSAAVRAQTGGSLEEVVAAAEEARGIWRQQLPAGEGGL